METAILCSLGTVAIWPQTRKLVKELTGGCAGSRTVRRARLGTRTSAVLGTLAKILSFVVSSTYNLLVVSYNYNSCSLPPLDTTFCSVL